MFIARVPMRQFVRAVREPATIAFATTSSESAMPKAMTSERLGVPQTDRRLRHADGLLVQS